MNGASVFEKGEEGGKRCSETAGYSLILRVKFVVMRRFKVVSICKFVLYQCLTMVIDL